MALIERYAVFVLGAFLRTLLVVALAFAPTAMTDAMPANDAALLAASACPDMPSMPLASKGCAMTCVAALPAIQQIANPPEMPRIPAYPTRSRMGQPIAPDVATPPPRLR